MATIALIRWGRTGLYTRHSVHFSDFDSMESTPPSELRTKITKQLVGLATRFAFNETMPLSTMRTLVNQLGRIASAPEGIELQQGEVDGVPYDFLTPQNLEPGRFLIYSHGGGYTLFSRRTHRSLAARLAQELAAQAIVYDYRLAPEHQFPAAIEDALIIYRYALRAGYDPKNIIFAGDSAGGGITFALMLAARHEGLPLPGLAIGLSPWVDMTLSGISMRENADTDVMLTPTVVEHFREKYLGSHDPKHPYASPLFADLKGFPPVMLQAAGDEILRDDSVSFAAALRAAGVKVELDIWPGLFHVFEFAWRWLPESEEAITRIGDFVRRHFSLKS